MPLPSDPTASSPIPSVLGRCEVGAEIGRGGMGTVYRGRHQTLDLPVAVKVLSPEHVAAMPQLAERFLREARLAAKIDHPNVIRVLDCGEEQGLYFLVMELVEGRGLDDLVAAGPLPPTQAVEITLSVARALEAAWGKQIIHRDIKPANVLLTSDGRVKLADLGLAKMLDVDPGGQGLTSTGQMMGTVLYMSPEQLTNPQAVDIRSDIYSLGATLFELVEGRPPFDGATAFSIAERHQNAERPPVAAACEQPALEDLIQRTMAIAPANRPQTPTELIAELEALLVELGGVATSSVAVGASASAVASGGGAASAGGRVAELADTVVSDADLALAPTPAAMASGAQPGPGGGKGFRWWLVVAPIVALALLGGGLWLYLGRSVPSAESASSAATSSPPGKSSVSTTVDRVPDTGLHGAVTDLGGGKVRVAYDFSTKDQMSDFRPASESVIASIDEGQLHISWAETADPDDDPLAVVLAKRSMRVDRLSFRVRIADGDHVNWYVQTIWESDAWCPPRGYGGVHREDGRLGCLRGQHPDDGSGEGTRTGTEYAVRIDVEPNQIRWQIDGKTTTVASAIYQGTDRQWAVGSWGSHTIFDDIVVEGQLGGAVEPAASSGR